MSLPISFTIFIILQFVFVSNYQYQAIHIQKVTYFPLSFMHFIHNQLCSARVLMQQVLYRRVMAKESSLEYSSSYMFGLRPH
jgi:hypothetical protein